MQATRDDLCITSRGRFAPLRSSLSEYKPFASPMTTDILLRHPKYFVDLSPTKIPLENLRFIQINSAILRVEYKNQSSTSQMVLLPALIQLNMMGGTSGLIVHWIELLSLTKMKSELMNIRRTNIGKRRPHGRPYRFIVQQLI